MRPLELETMLARQVGDMGRVDIRSVVVAKASLRMMPKENRDVVIRGWWRWTIDHRRTER